MFRVYPEGCLNDDTSVKYSQPEPTITNSMSIPRFPDKLGQCGRSSSIPLTRRVVLSNNEL